jgi:hypothetical protein
MVTLTEPAHAQYVSQSPRCQYWSGLGLKRLQGQDSLPLEALWTSQPRWFP